MNGEIPVSVVLPTYNRMKQLPDAVESVLHQTHRELELIIVDDASTDGTIDYVNSLEDKRVRYIHLEQNVGPAVARNIGIKSSRYELIAFEDSDDLWKPEKLEIQISALDKQIGMVYCAYTIEDENGRKSCIPSRLDDRTVLSGNIYNRLRRGNVVGTPTILVKKSCLVQIGGFSEGMRSIEDWDLALRIAEITKVKYIDEILVEAYSSPAGVNRHMKNRINSELYMLEKFNNEEVLENTLLQYALDDVQTLNTDKELNYYKEKIQQKDIGNNKNFELLWHINRMKKRFENHNAILRAMCSDKRVKRFIGDQIHSQDTVAVYGLGILGMAWIDKMEDLSISIHYVIDRNVFSYRQYIVIKQLEELKVLNISKIIVTIPEQYFSIVRDLKGYLECDYINIMDILNV